MADGWQVPTDANKQQQLWAKSNHDAISIAI